MAVSGSLRALLDIAESVNTENQSGAVIHKIDVDLRFDDGTGNGQVDKVWSDRRTLATGNEDIDLAGSLSGRFGGTITFVKIRAILVRNRNTTDGDDLEMKAPAANFLAGLMKAASDGIMINAGGCVLWYDPNGITVTAGTGDLINFVVAGANSVVYDILILGTSA